MATLSMRVVPGGERVPFLLDDRGVPLFYPTLFATTQLRNNGAAVNTIRNKLSDIVVLLRWEAIVKRQIRARQFTRDVIDTIGNRIEEVVLPIPKSAKLRKAISDAVKNVVEKRVSARDTIVTLAKDIAPEPESVAQ